MTGEESFALFEILVELLSSPQPTKTLHTQQHSTNQIQTNFQHLRIMTAFLAFFGDEFSELVQAEKESHKTHEVVRNNDVFNMFLTMIPKIKEESDMAIMAAPNTAGGLAYDHYYLVIGNIVFEFGGGELKNAKVQATVCDPHRIGAVTKRIIPVKQWDLYIGRMCELIGMSSYSICLRNCEHVVNYVTSGKWVSSQVIKGLHESLFASIVLRVRPSHHFANIPNGVELSKEEVLNLAQCGVAYRPYRWFPQGALDPVDDEPSFKCTLTGVDKTGMQIKKETRVVLLLGPTGAGKSRAINLVFGHLTGSGVAKSEMSAESVNKELIFYYGAYAAIDQPTMHVCFIDSIGLCDSALSDDEVVALVKAKVDGLRYGLNHVLMVFHGRLEKPQQDAVSSILKWIKLTPKHTTMLVTKCDTLNDDTKREYEASWLDSPLIGKLQQVRDGEPPFVPFGEQVNNFKLVGMPNATELHAGLRDFSVEACKQSRLDILARVISFDSDKIELNNKSIFQKLFGDGCSIL